MDISNHKKSIIFLIISFVISRIPVILILDLMGLQEILFNNLIRGYIIYCDFNKFELSSFWQEHILPPGAYIHFIIVFIFFNIPLLIYELINMFLLYKIILKYSGKDSALLGMIFIAFFPMSILNGIIELDPMSPCLLFILLSFYFFIENKPILSSISLAIGTLILYIPFIIIIPIIFYYLKNQENRLKNIIKYLIFFIGTIFLGIVLFLLTCFKKFIFYINYSINLPHTSNFLQNKNFFLSKFFYTPIITIYNFNIRIINFFQIGIIFIISLILFIKLSYKNKYDIIFSSIILIILISILSFYIHFRITYWIFSLSTIILSHNVEKFNKENLIKKILLIGIYYFFISIVLLLICNIYVEPKNYGNFTYTFIQWYVLIFLFYLIGFIFLGFFIIKEKKLIINILYASIMLIFFILFQYTNILINLSSLLYNLILILFIIIEIWLLILFILTTLYPSYKKLIFGNFIIMDFKLEKQ